MFTLLLHTNREVNEYQAELNIIKKLVTITSKTRMCSIWHRKHLNYTGLNRETEMKAISSDVKIH